MLVPNPIPVEWNTLPFDFQAKGSSQTVSVDEDPFIPKLISSIFSVNDYERDKFALKKVLIHLQFQICVTNVRPSCWD